MNTVYDGFVSRHLNRKISEPIAGLLARTPLTPNTVTLGSFSIAIACFVAFLIGLNIVGGILAQVSSIADGIDGGLARRKNMTSAFGSFFDALLDRYSDSLIILGVTIWAATNEAFGGIWLVGFAAMIGTLVVSYSRARIEPQFRTIFDRGLTSLASRDVRIFIIMIGSISGQLFFTLLFIALLTNAIAIFRLVYIYRLYAVRKNTVGTTKSEYTRVIQAPVE
jgi:1L-myo-inositol 1-phosphate cytidylyltransferase / CDP-L-myo-inositol myo-inositolphosphotransferase